MRAFGLELRKTGNVNELYKDVDLILASSSLREVQKMSIAHALQRMLRVDNFFSVCTIDACMDVCQIPIPRERYAIYRAAHCIHWNEMLPDFKQQLIAMVLDDFRQVLNPIS